MVKIIGYLWKQYVGCFVLVLHGVTCQRTMATGKALTDDGIAVVIPSKKNRLHPTSHDRDIYKERNIVERFFQKIKRFRMIATRYDKTARMYLTGVMFVSILLALK
jgi:transposase